MYMHSIEKRAALVAGAIALGALVSATMLIPTAKLRADEPIDIGPGNFPDEKFCQELKKYDLDTDGFLQEEEIAAITELDLKDSGIKDLTGIGLLSSLEVLDCSGCEITELNLSGLEALEELNCSDCELSELEISNMEMLKKLTCSNNKIKALYVYEMMQLTYLDCSKNPLEAFDVYSCPNLETIRCSKTSLKQITLGGDMESLQELYVNDNAYLTSLLCTECGLKKLSIQGCTSLKSLSVERNALEELNLDDQAALESLFCYENNIKKLDLSHSPKLKLLYCEDNQLETLDFSKTPLLEDLDCGNTGLKVIDVSMLPGLKALTCIDNDLTKIDVSKNTKLKELFCGGNPIQTIDVSKLTELEELSIRETDVSTLDISKNVKLKLLSLSQTKLSSIDLSNQKDLQILWIDNTSFSEIDLSSFKNLTELDVSETQIKSLDLCQNKKLESLVCTGLDLTTLSLRFNPELYYLDISDTDITYLNISPCSLLVDLVTNTSPIVSDGKYYVYEKEGEDYYHFLKCNKETNISTDMLPVPTPYPAVAMPDVRSMKSEEAQSKIKETLRSPSFCDVGFKIVLEEGADSSKDLYVTKQDPEAGAKLYGNHSSIEVTLTLANMTSTPTPTPFPPAKMPNVIGSDYEVAQDTIRNAVKSHGFDGVDFKIVWVDNDDFDKSLTVLEQDPKAGETLYGNHSTLNVTLKVAKKAGEKDPSFEDFVERLYTVALNRASEPEGKAFWIKQVVEEGKTGADCARFFLLDADEFMKRGLSVEEFVETLYATFFDRESDPAGKQGWVSAIKTKAKTRAEVVNDFIESTEWCDVCATYGVKSGAKWHKATKASKNAINFATRLYTCCLKRDPEEDGIKFWSLALTNLEKTGAQAAQFFFESEEFIGFKTTEKDYIIRLYTTFMDREPAESEINYWLGELKTGKQTRKSIISFFAQSPEFTGICKKYGIERGEIA